MIRAYDPADDELIKAAREERRKEHEIEKALEACLLPLRLERWVLRKHLAALSPADLAEYVRLSKLVYEHGEGAK
jgi:hypothetical protein